MNYNITVHLGVDDISAILKKHFLKERNMVVGDMQFSIVKEICGYGPGEHECINFKGITFKCEHAPAVPECTPCSIDAERIKLAAADEHVGD